MSAERPDYQDADLILRLYDMRREPVMRDSRDAMFRDFAPRSFDELKAITNNPQHPLNRAWRQTSSYWEMAYGFAKHGIVNADYLAENCGEGLFLFAKVAPYLEQFRAEGSPTAFQNTEWIVKNSRAAAQRFETVKKRIEVMTKNR